MDRGWYIQGYAMLAGLLMLLFLIIFPSFMFLKALGIFFCLAAIGVICILLHQEGWWH